MVTGLACLELLKVLQNKPLEQLKNGFVNLALPFVGFSEPIPPSKQKCLDTEFSVWDSWVVEGDLTVEEFMKYIQQKYKIQVDTLVLPTTGIALYMTMLSKKTREERINVKISELARTVGKYEIHPSQKYISLEMLTEDENGEDVDVPSVTLKFK